MILLSMTLCRAKTPQKQYQNAVSLKLGKTGFIYSLNFDHKLTN
jgi:hypothetical protein